MMNPMKVNRKPSAMNGKRHRVRSDAKASTRSIIAPVTFGA